jgi:hypothetical protein
VTTYTEAGGRGRRTVGGCPYVDSMARRDVHLGVEVQTCPRVVIYARHTMSSLTGDLTSQQKEWFSRAFLVGLAASAGFPVELRLNDVAGVDATVYDGGVGVDWQLKGTSAPEYNADKTILNFDPATTRPQRLRLGHVALLASPTNSRPA